MRSRRTSERVGGRRRRNRWLARALRGGVTLLAVAAAAPAAAAHAGAPSGHRTLLPEHEATPPGWKTYDYAGVTVAAPADWAVEREDACPSSTAPGLLVLGEPFALGIMCPEERVPGASVVLNTSDTPPEAMTGVVRQPLHGVAVEVVPAGHDDASSMLWAPSLGVEAWWSGPGAAGVVATVHPLQPVPLSDACRRAALAAALVSAGRSMGLAHLPASPVSPTPSSPNPPGVSDALATDSPEFADLVTAGLQVFDGVIADAGPAAFYASKVEPSRRSTLMAPECRGRAAGIETLTAAVSGHTFGPPWTMTAITEPGWRGGALLFRGECPGGVQPSATTAPCDGVEVSFTRGAVTPGAARGLLGLPAP